jgi:hypothetical protein
MVPGSILRTARYEGESVNRSRMYIKYKTCDIRAWKKHLFLDISSTNIDTLVPLLLPVRRNPQHRNILTVVSVTSAVGRIVALSVNLWKS